MGGHQELDHVMDDIASQNLTEDNFLSVEHVTPYVLNAIKTSYSVFLLFVNVVFCKGIAGILSALIISQSFTNTFKIYKVLFKTRVKLSLRADADMHYKQLIQVPITLSGEELLTHLKTRLSKQPFISSLGNHCIMA